MIDMYISNGKQSKLIDLDNLKPEDFDIEYIAHSLSLQCRFNGNTPEQYSVAQHSVYVSDTVSSFHEKNETFFESEFNLLKLYALLHDAHEMILGDITTPAQKLIYETFPQFPKISNVLDILKGDIDFLIWKQFNLEKPSELFQQAIKKADSYMCNLELTKFFGNEESYINLKTSRCYPFNQLSIGPKTNFQVWSPKIAKYKFIDRFNKLVSEL